MRPASPTIRLLLAAGALALRLHAQVAVSGRVVDETGAPVAGARVELRVAGAAAASASSDPAGNFALSLPAAGEFDVRAERQGFYVFQGGGKRLENGPNQLIVTLNHLQEFYERVDVSSSPPAVDPDQTSDRRELDGRQAQTVPFPGPQDFKNALPLENGVLQDTSGNLHVNGGGSAQTSYSLDGFNIADPVTGGLYVRVNIETIQAMALDGNRFSADTGRGSAGALDLRTKMGDDRWRFGGTNFIPGASLDGGFHINKWTPRVEFSGPVKRGRAWFHNGFDAFYYLDVIHGLPKGQNRTRGIVISDLARFQINLAPSNILTGSALVNIETRFRSGLSVLNPVDTTSTRRHHMVMTTLRDQQYFGGALLEVGFADTRSEGRDSPQGDRPYEITPYGNRGNYFERSDRHAYRQQWLGNLYLPVFRFRGEHQWKFGADAQREAFDQVVSRHEYQIVRDDGSLARRVSFSGTPRQEKKSFEGALYVQDHWMPGGGLALDVGIRADWNAVVRAVEAAPRLAMVWAPRRLADTKFSAGWGVYYDWMPLSILAGLQGQTSLSAFFAPGGVPQGQLTTSYRADDRTLVTPRYRALSGGIERRLPKDFFWKAEYTRRVGNRGLAYRPLSALPPAPGPAPGDSASVLYALGNTRNDRYDAVDFSLRHTFARQYEWFGGYTWSHSRTNEANEFTLQNPVFARQAPGPYPWDATHRFHMWGWLPLPDRSLPRAVRFITRNISAAYLLEYRTGFPFSVVDEAGYQLGAPGARRFPDYFNINFHLERRFQAMHYMWAWRFGFNNLTGHNNPNVVNNIEGTSNFLRYGGGQVRAFSVRLRMLGRK